MSLFEELKRRNVFRVAIAYVLLGWAVLQGADFMLDLVGAPDWVIRVFVVAGLVGLPFALFLAWAYELTPEGIKREEDVDRSQSITPRTGRKLDRIIIGLLLLVVVLMAVERLYFAETAAPATEVEAAQTPKSIAVLPFVPLSSGPDDGYFADGLTEEILNALAQLPELLVTARTSSFQFRGQDVDVQDIGRRLGVAHIVEGSIRRSGERLRVTAQLVRASDGFHLWSNNYDARSDDTISVQEDIAEQIALALDVLLDDERLELMQNAGLRNVEAFIAFQRAREIDMRAHYEVGSIRDMLEPAVLYLDQVLELVPGYPPALKIRADYAAHQMWESSNSIEGPWLGKTEWTAAQSRFESDLKAAMGAARSDEERENIAFTLAYVTGDWRGIRKRIEEVVRQSGCDIPVWFETIANGFGYAAAFAPRVRAAVNCDPLYDYNWRVLAETLLAAGDVEGALNSAQRAREALGTEQSFNALVAAHLQAGNPDRARLVAESRTGESPNAFGEMVMFEAALGNAEAASHWFDDFREDAVAQGHRTLAMLAWLGEREEANRLAAQFDERPMGPVVLSTAIEWCRCGAPWDLEATPRFAQKLSDAGLDWPPVKALDFPLKYW